jgi:hypothetical protein
MYLCDEKKKFLKITNVGDKEMAFTNSWKAAVQRSKIYNLPVTTSECRKTLRSSVKNSLMGFVDRKQSPCNETELLDFISSLSNNISRDFGSILLEKRFRIGTAQKATNLFLKFLWCLEEAKRPPHLPIDRKVQTALPYKSRIAWTKLDSLKQYENTIELFKAKCPSKHLAEWELHFWNRQSSRKNGFPDDICFAE